MPRKGGGDRRNGRSKKKAKCMTISDDESEAAITGKEHSPDDLIFDYVPNAELGDVFAEGGDGAYEMFALKCRGCFREFDVHESENMRRFIRHCLRDCDTYQLQMIAKQCDVCQRYCADAAALVKHQTAVGSACNLTTTKDRTETADSPSIPSASISRRTTIEKVKAPDDETEVITIADSSDPSIPRLAGVCYDYVPDESAGDVVKWNGTGTTIESTKCKGCGTVFSTLMIRDQVIFVNHCITECPDYQAKNLIVFCYPCRLNCMDQNAFIEHVISCSDCPAHSYLKFKANKTGARPQNGNSDQSDTIQLD